MHRIEKYMLFVESCLLIFFGCFGLSLLTKWVDSYIQRQMVLNYNGAFNL